MWQLDVRRKVCHGSGIGSAIGSCGFAVRDALRMDADSLLCVMLSLVHIYLRGGSHMPRCVTSRTTDGSGDSGVGACRVACLVLSCRFVSRPAWRDTIHVRGNGKDNVNESSNDNRTAQ